MSEKRPLPFIVRLAGLPADSLEAFESSVCAAPLDQLVSLEDEIEQERKALVERLYEHISSTDGDLRRQLVALKRDVFNGRSLGRWPQRGEWPSLEPVAGPGLGKLLELEGLWQEQLEALRSGCEDQQRREEQSLEALTHDPVFVRGLGLSSLGLAQGLPRLSGGKLRAKRRRRMMTGLLRYATRAALKLSPFSTLTPVGLGRAVSGAASPLAVDLEARSGLWLHRYFLDQLVDVLGEHPAIRAGLRLRVNDTLDTLPDGRLRFLRPRRWEPNHETRKLERRQPALVRVGLSSPVVDHLRRDADGMARPLGEVLAELVAAFPDREEGDLLDFVNRLIDIGFLLASPPWPSTEVDVQGRLLSYLEERRGADPRGAAELQGVMESLQGLVAVLEALPSSEEPASLLARAKALSEQLGERTLAAVGVETSVRFFEEPRDHYFSEDVFMTPRALDARFPDGGDAVLRLPEEEVEGLTEAVAPLAHLTGALDNRIDYLLTLSDAARERWPGAESVALLDFFEGVQPVYREFIRYQMDARRIDRPRDFPPFNPRGLTAIVAAKAARHELSAQLRGLFRPTDEGYELDHAGLVELLSSMSGVAGHCRDFSAFLQPVENGSRRWVLTDLFEGAGRLSSRYTTAMPAEVRRRWSASFSRRATLGLQGQPAEILDLYCPDGHTLNVHAPQTRRLLELPGESLDVDRESRLRLRDLSVDLVGPVPVLTDPAGKCLAPLHLGGVVARYMPSLFKFLTLLGTTELLYRIPVAAGRDLEDMRVVERHSIGGVVYRRKTWTLDRSKVLPRFEKLRGPDLLRAVDRWRRRRGVPDQVFMQEPVEGGLSNPHRKPQFIDFRSPLLVELFRSILLNDFPAFLLAEALPATGQHPLAQDGKRRAFEIQIDTFGAIGGAEDPVGALVVPALSEGSSAMTAGEL